ncbi:MAG: hypothetical protein ACI87O_001402 [Planctomycetota bacterium]|jgi:hypothetical protein
MSSDPLDLLRQTWKSESHPAPAENLDQADPDTQHKVRALQDAWKQQSVDCPVDIERLKQRYRQARNQRPHRLRRLPPVIAALALAAALLIWNSLYKSEPLQNPGLESKSANLIAPEIKTTDEQAARPEPEPRDPRIRNVPQDAITYRKDGIELVSGSVRLVLVQPNTPKTH